MCAGGTRDAGGGSGDSPPPGFGCPSRGERVCPCASVSAWGCVPAHSLTPFGLLYLGIIFFFGGGGADCPSFPALSNSKATSLAARSTRGKTLKILGSPSPHHTRHTPTSPKTKAAACPGWTPPPLNTPPMGGCVGFFFWGGGQPRGSPPRAYPSPRAPPLIHPSPPPPPPMPFPTLPKFLSPFKLRYRL